MTAPYRAIAVSIALALSGTLGFAEDSERSIGPPPFVPVHPGDHGDAWCPSGSDLEAYLHARTLMPRKRLARGVDVPPEPVVTSVDGVLVVEDDGVILVDDRVLDLALPLSIELVPSGGGYQIDFVPAAYEPLGAKDDPLFVDQSSWRSEPFSLRRFTFPFGGQSRTDMWVTSTNLIAFEAPTEPVKVGLCSVGCYLKEGEILLDRTPRISPYQHGSFLYGWNAFVREERDHVVFTWQYDDPANLDIQAVLFDDGRIRFNYNQLSGIPWGGVLAVDGNDAFWNDLSQGGDAVDPQGDVAFGPPDGPAMDFVSASARQVGSSEILHVEFTLDQGPPPTQARTIYRIQLRDEVDDVEPVGTVTLQWQNGQFYYATEPVRLTGDTIELNLRLFDLPLNDGTAHLTFTSTEGTAPFGEGDRMELPVTFVAPTGPAMLDLTSDLPATTGSEPVYEAFTLPALLPGEVLKVTGPRFEDETEVEAFPIYQNLWTDIIFFAGGYHAGGNAGVDGIGFGTSQNPRSPSLLHINNIANYDAEDWAMTVLSHEFGHRFLYHFEIEENGEPTRILNPAGGHPAGWVHTPAIAPVYHPFDYSVMGGSYWTDNGDGTFSTPTELDGGPNGFSWHEMYLLGLADPVEVADWWYLRDAVPGLPNAYWPDNDITVLGTRVPVTIDQIVAAEGPRFPAYPNARSHFTNPMVLVVRPGQFSQDDLDTVNTLCSTWVTRFDQATTGRGGVRCRFSPPVVDITSHGSDFNVIPGDTVDFVGASSDDDGDAVEMRWTFSDAAPDTTGTGPHPVTYTSTGTYPVTLEGVDDQGMLAESADGLTVTVDCPSTFPTESVSGLRLGKEAGQIRFTWTDSATPGFDYVVLEGDVIAAPFYPQGSAPSGDPGLLLPTPSGIAYYKVAVRNADGCLGPI